MRFKCNFLRPISTNEDLINFGYEQLENIWKTVEQQADIRRSWVNEADRKYHRLENERIDSVSKMYRLTRLLYYWHKKLRTSF